MKVPLSGVRGGFPEEGHVLRHTLDLPVASERVLDRPSADPERALPPWRGIAGRPLNKRVWLVPEYEGHHLPDGWHPQIVEGDVLVLGTFFPKAGWDAGLAMARNVYIYGLAEEIYVAESSDKGGTWTGVMDGLKKGRTIYVRQPEDDEKNANALLIAKGAVAVDAEGNPLQVEAATVQPETAPDQMTLFE